MNRIPLRLILLLLFLSACTPATPPASRQLKIDVVIDAGSENDRSFNEYTLKGAREAAQAAGMAFSYVTPQAASDYERTIEALVVDEKPDLVITVGFRMGDATARVARRHPDIRFAVIDNAYTPGSGCPDTVSNCYTPEGGLANVTSLMFAEDQLGYLAGTLAACMSKTGTIASVAGEQLPPVVRFVTGFQTGAKAARPDIIVLNQYIPDFNDPDSGKVTAQDFIRQDADVIFGVAGNTGNGALQAAYEAGLMAIGVDVDQYLSYPEVRSSLLTSASKKMDVAAGTAVRDFAAGKLQPGIRISDLANGGIDLAPYHDWDTKIPSSCKQKVEDAKKSLLANPAITGVK